MATRFDYDVALSFASEDRPYVEKVAEALRKAGVRVFYDRYEEATLWGKNLYEHLDQVYRERAKFCVVFVSKHYESKLWTTHERRSAQARALSEHQEYILPARFDDTHLPGILPAVGYVDLRQKRPEEVAMLVQQKLTTADKNSLNPILTDPPSVSSFITERAAYWRERNSRLWLVAALIPGGPAKLDAQSDSIMNVLHDLRLPDYLAELTTAAPNRYKTRSTKRGLIHEDFRALGDGVAFRFEIRESGLIEYAICLALASRTPVDLVKREVKWCLPGSAPLERCERLLVYHPLAVILASQVQALTRLWNEPPVPIEFMTLSAALFGVKGHCLLVSNHLDALLGYPCEDDEIVEEVPAQKGKEYRALCQELLPLLIRDFGLRLDQVYNEGGELNSPAAFGG